MTTPLFFYVKKKFLLVRLKNNCNVNSILSTDTITNNDIIQAQIWVKR